MANYRRNRVAGGTYAFTVNLADRRSDLLVARVEALRGAVRMVKGRLPFHVDAWVVLPDHMHCIWTLPQGDTDYPTRWKRIKGAFSQSQPAVPQLRASLVAKGERGIWQRRYWEHTIRDERDYATHMDYVHFNPVKHGFVERAGDWPYSTFARCVARGFYAAQWGGEGSGGVDFGELRA